MNNLNDFYCVNIGWIYIFGNATIKIKMKMKKDFIRNLRKLAM